MKHATFTLELRVDDVQRLYTAALRSALSDGLSENEATEFLKDEDGTVSVHSCLVQLIDPGHLPGCSISDSSVEEYDQ